MTDPLQAVGRAACAVVHAGDFDFGGGSMPKPCSLDLRERVLETVESGALRR
ncbi:MAG: hypothetical protein ABR881_32250 [Candidatus Sulfotelmatobacter sp.]